MKRNNKNIVLEKYNIVYRLCIVKYFAFIKSSENQAKFFSVLAEYCGRLVQNSKCKGVKLRQNEVDSKKVQQNFCRDTHKVLWRKNLVDAAYLLGYGKLMVEDVTSNESKHNHEKVQDILSYERLWSFLHEIERIIKKNDDFEVMSDKLKDLFQNYKLSFIKN